MKKKLIIFLFAFIIISILVINISYAFNNNVESNEYKVVNKKIYAIPTSFDYRASEFINKVDFRGSIEMLDKSNKVLNIDDRVGTSSKFVNKGTSYDIVLLGDVTGDGVISLGDVSRLYNTYKGTSNLSGDYLEAGKITNNKNITLGDVSKLYNFYKGNSPFSYYSSVKDLNTEEKIEEKETEMFNLIRSTPNTDISDRLGKIIYVSNDGDDSNDGLSESNPIKTLDKVNEMFKDDLIPESSAVLFRDGDTFKGRIVVKKDNIVLGSYGDIKKGKPLLTRSLHNGVKEGNWIEVKPNIWKYTINDNDEVFAPDVGVVWMFCDKGNNNCSKSMNNYDRTFEYSQKIITDEDYDETNLDDKIDTILTNDLESYHAGHASRSFPTGKALYLYSTSNPKTRFDDIEFSLTLNLIECNNFTDLKVDNLKMYFTGSHAVSTLTLANLVITNNEFGFIGGGTQKYENNKGLRYGNAVQVWGGVEETNGKPVNEGFVVDNNISYQIYDTAYTWQYTLNKPTKVEKCRISNNVMDYNGAVVEYWFNNKEHREFDDDSYVNDFVVINNLFLRAGYGIVETRPNKEQFGFIASRMRYLNVIGEIQFKNNVFWLGKVKFMSINANNNNYPNLVNNVFYTDNDILFMEINDEGQKIKYNPDLLNVLYPYNIFLHKDKSNKPTMNDSGQIGTINWEYIASTNTLNITGNGSIPDYSLDNLPPWSKYSEYIYNINIGENITNLGNYSFYNFVNLINVRIDARHLDALDKEANDWNGSNYVFYNAGISSNGVKVTFGPKVEIIPDFLFIPEKVSNNNVNITNVYFEGNNITSIGYYALTFIKQPIVVLNDGINSVTSMSLGYNNVNLLILPDSLHNISDYLFNGNVYMEKIVFGSSINKISRYTFRRCNSLKTIVIPHIEDTSIVNNGIFEHVTNTNIIIYGDLSTKEFVDNYNALNTGKTLEYKPLDSYTSSITSNSDINDTVSYNGSYSFTTDREVKVYYKYRNDYSPDLWNSRRTYYQELPVEKDGNTYTINNIKSDVYIEIK